MENAHSMGQPDLGFHRGRTGAKVSGVEIPVADLADAPDSVHFAGMIPISGGTFRMGSSQHYPEEAPSIA